MLTDPERKKTPTVAIELWLARLLQAWYERWNATWPPGLMYKQNVYVAVLGVQVASYT